MKPGLVQGNGSEESLEAPPGVMEAEANDQGFQRL